MSTSLAERRVDARPSNGGAPARRAVVRWSWRLFRREWRQQALVLTLLLVAIAATTVGLGLVTNVAASHDQSTFGTANRVLNISGTSQDLRDDVAAAQKYFGAIDVIAHQKVAIPGSVATIDLRAQDPNGAYGQPMLRLDSGRYPTGPDEIAVTSRVARIFNLHLGHTWHVPATATPFRVVGIVENPNDLHEAFALVAPGQANRPSTVDVLLHTTDANLRGFHLPSGGPLSLSARGALDQSAPAIAVLVLATIGLMFIGLLSVGGFAVLAARRQRALGMLGALGATDRHIRLVMVANGALVGAVGALVGSGLGIGSWLAFAPQLEGLIGRRVNRFDLPWWAIGAATLLAVLTALGSAWWPARASARVSIVAALSGRPSRPQPAHRFAVLGVALLVAGPVLLALSHQRRPVFIVVGIVATTVGVLLLAPLSIRALAPVAQRAPVAVRLALRDLARYQARSGAALGAITLAVGIAATIAINAAASQAASTAATGGNLPDNHLVVYLSAHGNGSPVPEVTPAQLQTAQTSANAIASAVGSHDVLALETAVNPKAPNEPGGQGNGAGGKFPTGLAKVQKVGNGEQISPVGSTYLASPAVLAHFGINPTQIDPTVDILTSQTDVAGLQLFTGARGGIEHPKIQTVALPRFSSDPNTLITAHAVQTLGLSAAPTAWLIESPRPLTSAQVDRASSLAAGAGLTVETQSQHQTLTQLRNDATAAGVLLALGVLAMSVGLIRSESGRDLRALTAAGAASTTRRTITSATAAALALLGALLGTAGAYVALLAWYHHDLHPMRHPPVVNLLTIVIGLPLLAAICGWLLAGREPQAIARQPLE
jgi:putative ABC transport system permease protein